jgi:hypothetical protein
MTAGESMSAIQAGLHMKFSSLINLCTLLNTPLSIYSLLDLDTFFVVTSS